MAQRKAAAAQDGKTQHQRFVDAAKKLGADTDPEAFRRVATADTPTKAKKAARKRKA